MADISLVIDVKQNGVTSAVKNTKALERNVKLLSDSFKGGGLSQRQYYKGLLELAQASGKSESELRKYANELRRAERASAAAAAQARLEAQARRDAAAAARVAAAAQRAATQAAAEAARAARTQADANRRLRMEFREGYAAQVALRAAQMRLNQARRQGIVTEEEYQRQLARLNEINRGNVRGTNNLGVAMQQTGYQVGDFLVQIQSGTNPMVAFGQQATQLVGVLYLLPPAMLAASRSIMGFSVSVGFLIASLGIIIPFATAIGAYFMRMKEASDSSAKATEKLDEKIKSLKNSLVDYADAQEALTSGVSLDEYFSIKNFEKATDELKKAKEDLEDLTISEGLVGGVLGAIPFIGDKTGVQAELDAYNAALEKVIDAEKVLADLRKKEADERFKNFDRSRVELEEELSMAQEIARFGKDSSQVAKLELEQRITAFNRNIDQQVASNNLNAIHAHALKLINAELANTEFATEEIARNQEVLKEGAQGFLNIWNSITGRITESVAQIKDAVTALDQMKIEFSFRGRSMAQYGGRSTVSNRPISGDVPEDAEVTRGGAASIKDPLPELLKRLALDERLLGVSKEREAVERAIADSDVTYSQASIDAAVKRLEAYNLEKQALEEVAATQEKIASILESSMESAFMSMVDGTKLPLKMPSSLWPLTLSRNSIGYLLFNKWLVASRQVAVAS
jgi:hypothetical protein